jgi:hypothetical protein
LLPAPKSAWARVPWPANEQASVPLTGLASGRLTEVGTGGAPGAARAILT